MISSLDQNDMLLRGKTLPECWLQVGEDIHAIITRDHGIPHAGPEANAITRTILGMHDLEKAGFGPILELIAPGNQVNLEDMIGMARGRIQQMNQLTPAPIYVATKTHWEAGGSSSSRASAKAAPLKNREIAPFSPPPAGAHHSPAWSKEGKGFAP